MVSNNASESPGDSRRYDHIDALRAVAALLVLCLHIPSLLDPVYPCGGACGLFDWIAATFDLGRVGVVLFFAISGFVIPFSLRGPRAEGARRFLIRRFFRLYPAYWLSVALTAVTVIWINKLLPLDVASLAAQATMVQEFLGYNSLNGVAWTLHIELIFYAICLGLYLLGVLQNPRTFTLMILFAGLSAWCFERLVDHIRGMEQRGAESIDLLYRLAKQIVRSPTDTWQNYSFMLIVYLSIMALGALLRLWYEGKLTNYVDRTILLAACAYWFVFQSGPIVRAALSHPLFWPGARTYLSHSVPVIIFVVFACFIKIRSPAMTYLGRISYSIYLFHYPVIIVALWMIRDFPSMRGLPLAAWYALIVVVTIGLSALIYTILEKPANDLGHRLSSHVSAASVENQQGRP